MSQLYATLSDVDAWGLYSRPAQAHNRGGGPRCTLRVGGISPKLLSPRSLDCGLDCGQDPVAASPVAEFVHHLFDQLILGSEGPV